ncbi:MAG TPA: glucoamylase family protein, partial [Opitutaceae bacterium]
MSWFLGCAVAFLIAGQTVRAASTAVQLTAADHALLEDLERTASMFFDEQAHPRTSLVRDRARADGSPSEGAASISASGFAFSAWVVATERGWVERSVAMDRVRKKLRFLADEVPRHHGFFYHFMEMATGARTWGCELSSIDSALLFAGAIVAREYFDDPEITELTNRLLGEVDWEWFRNGGTLVSLGWHPEPGTGFSRYRWNKYSEHLLMSFMALGVSARPVEAGYWQTWDRTPLGRYGDYIYLQEPPLFVHQFPHGFVDMRDRRDAHADYFKNSRLATLAQRQMSLDLRNEFPSWSEVLWGLTASDSATG